MITTTAALAAFCDAHRQTEFVTVDTEFMRERTYWPKLCLIQLGGPEETVAVDPLAEGIDLSPLFELLQNASVLKVFHAARQDIEIFYNLTGKVPTPMFDTQVAAMVCGFGEAASYETLAGQLANAKIDKSSRFTDWASRPLTDKQIDYALADVSHLRVVYAKLHERLQKSGRESWVSEEMADLTSVDTYHIEPSEVWKRFKWRADKPKLRALLKELAAWRELEAQRINVPRGRVMRDESVMEIAYHPPESARDLARIRGLGQGFADSRQGKEVLEAVQRALAIPLDKCPVGEPKRTTPQGSGAVIDLLKVLLRHVADENDVAAKLIATTDDLEKIATDDQADTAALRGWRYDLFGQQALLLKSGKLSMGLNKKKLSITKL